MKLRISLLFSVALAAACVQRSPSASSAAPPTPPQRVETAQVQESAPMATGIPSNTPPVAPPTAPLSPPPDQTPLTLRPASGVGEARTSAALVPLSPAQNQPDTAQDQESIQEIRALLAADRALAPLAHQVTIVARSGRVWLRGQVNTKEQRAAIERVARQAAGVVNVKNELVAME